jgi:hypothetical protein
VADQPEQPGLDSLTIGSFRECEGDSFAALLDGDLRLELELVEVRTLGQEPTGGRQPFSVLFRGPPEPVLPQATYQLGHAALGEHWIFIVPIARSERGTDYEAIFA